MAKVDDPIPANSRTYQVTFVPEGCKIYQVGELIRLRVMEPPDPIVTLSYAPPCVGIILELVP